MPFELLDVQEDVDSSIRDRLNNNIRESDAVNLPSFSFNINVRIIDQTPPLLRESAALMRHSFCQHN